MIPLLVTAYCDNSGILGVVTLKSLDEIFAVLVFPIRKQITMSIYFSLHLVLIGDLFLLSHICMII